MCIRDSNYTDSISADEDNHVATVSSDGHLFLMEGGAILDDLQMKDEQEVFKCCKFAPNGILMVGTSLNHVYSYEVSHHVLKLIGVKTCNDIKEINNINFIDDKTMFICADNGVSYFDASGYHALNTNDFANSIDNMLCDYQGNLWFTSSRLGLMRLAKSPFKDVYGSVGMERSVVNTIVFWQNNYYIGTDNGLDVVDRECRNEIENDLTSKLSDKRIRCMYVDSNDHLCPQE